MYLPLVEDQRESQTGVWLCIPYDDWESACAAYVENAAVTNRFSRPDPRRERRLSPPISALSYISDKDCAQKLLYLAVLLAKLRCGAEAQRGAATTEECRSCYCFSPLVATKVDPRTGIPVMTRMGRRLPPALVTHPDGRKADPSSLLTFWDVRPDWSRCGSPAASVRYVRCHH